MVTIVGQPNRTVYGTPADDTLTVRIETHGGRDEVWGGRGDDTVISGDGGVTAHGEAGNDSLIGGMGRDFLDGGDGNDYLFGSGADYLRGGPGDDNIQWSLRDPGTGQVDGGAGIDTLSLDGFRFFDELDDPLAQLVVTMTGESKGTITNDGVPELNFTGVNQIWNMGGDFERQTQMTYHGDAVDTNMAVIAGDYGDTLIGGAGDEVFVSGLSNDRFEFVFKAEGIGMGHDTVLNFGQDAEPTSDLTHGLDSLTIVGDAGQLTTTQVEHDGWTTFTSTYADGVVAHILDVDAVGLAPLFHSDALLIG
jgi:Ca2+-binding RTX toxin-like protein